MRLFKAGRRRARPLRLRPDRARAGGGGSPPAPPRPAPAATELSEEEAASWPSSPTALEARPDPDGALSWAVGRFEMGCGRESALEGLSDHLLALRAVLEGHGPVGASLPMRAAALIADESRWTGSRRASGSSRRWSWSAR